MIYPIGHRENPPILKFGKLYKVFENLFILKRGDLMHTCGWLFYYIWITWNDMYDLWTLGGGICLSLQSFSRWKSFHEGIRLLVPSLGHEAHRLDDAPPLTRHITEETFPLEELRYHEEITLYPLPPKHWPLEA
jgi:hypothetical protein